MQVNCYLLNPMSSPLIVGKRGFSNTAGVCYQGVDLFQNKKSVGLIYKSLQNRIFLNWLPTYNLEIHGSSKRRRSIVTEEQMEMRIFFWSFCESLRDLNFSGEDIALCFERHHVECIFYCHRHFFDFKLTPLKKICSGSRFRGIGIVLSFNGVK